MQVDNEMIYCWYRQLRMLVMLIGIDGHLLFWLVFYAMVPVIDSAVMALLRVDAGTTVSFIDLWNLKGVSTGTRNSPLYRNGVIDNGFKRLCPSVLEISHHNPFFNVMFKGEYTDSDLSSWLQTTPYYVRYFDFPGDVTSEVTPNADVIHKVYRTGFPQKVFAATYYPNNSLIFPIYYGSYQTPITGSIPEDGFKFYLNYKIEIWALYDDKECDLTDPNPPTSILDALTSIQLNNQGTTPSFTTDKEHQTTNSITEPSTNSQQQTTTPFTGTSNEMTESSTSEQQLYTTTSSTGTSNEMTSPSTTEQQLYTTTPFTGTSNEITESSTTPFTGTSNEMTSPSTTEQQLYTTTPFTGTSNEITESSTTPFTGTSNEMTSPSTTEQLYTTAPSTGTSNEMTSPSTTEQLYTTAPSTGTSNDITEFSITEQQLSTTTSLSGLTTPTTESGTTLSLQASVDNGCQSNPTEQVSGMFFQQTDSGHPTVAVSVNLWTLKFYSLVMCARTCSLTMDQCKSFYYIKDTNTCTGLSHIENGIDRPTNGQHYLIKKCT